MATQTRADELAAKLDQEMAYSADLQGQLQDIIRRRQEEQAAAAGREPSPPSPRPPRPASVPRSPRPSVGTPSLRAPASGPVAAAGGVVDTFSLKGLPANAPQQVRFVFEQAEYNPPTPPGIKHREFPIVIAAFPNSGTVDQWKADLYTNVLAAAARQDNLAVDWVALAGDYEVGDEWLKYVPGALAQLDRKLCAALLKCCSGELLKSMMLEIRCRW